MMPTNWLDFGSDPWNLLECVPTYIHIVPSFNAEYVWMMRETAKFYRREGNSDKAKQLNADAEDMAQRVLKLYAGNGVAGTRFTRMAKRCPSATCSTLCTWANT